MGVENHWNECRKSLERVSEIIGTGVDFVVLSTAGKRGPTPKKGKRLYFSNLFSMTSEELRNLVDPEDMSIQWSTKTISLYGKDEQVTYVALNLIWAKAKCRTLRYVLVNTAQLKPFLLQPI